MTSADAIAGGQWLEPRIDWSWPGERAAQPAAELSPPPWVRARPLAAPPISIPARRLHPRLAQGVLLACVFVVVCALFTLVGSLQAGHARALVRHKATTVRTQHVAATSSAAPALPPLTFVSRDGAGSVISTVSYHSAALAGTGSFLVYLPPKFSRTASYPVLYLLHGKDEQGESFLTLGLQATLDHLVATHQIAPMIAVMLNGSGYNAWRDVGASHYGSYVTEVQQLVDQMLPTVAERSGRAIAGFSMGGFGAMNVALENPTRFGVVESWLGYFDGLAPALSAARPTIAQLGLKAFMWGANRDPIANPSENAPFAAQLRAAGAQATSAVYDGTHNFTTLEAHLSQMLVFAGTALAP